MLAGVTAASAGAAINIETLPVGNPGNAPDPRYATSGYGSVSYTYNIGKYEVTAGQYCEFLNAVAKTDTYGLYSTLMDTAIREDACNIKRTGSSGSYGYSVASDWANRPVNYVTWGDALRLANWLNNGQPTTGVQNASTTEDGSYVLNGATSSADMATVTRNADAKWVMPSAEEWHKAAYYDPYKPGGAGYWDYPTRSDTMPSNVFSSTGTNNANYYDNGYTIGGPYLRTEVGAFVSSPSAYGTYDQGGNVVEWNETVFYGSWGGMRGGGYSGSGDLLLASHNGFTFTTYDSWNIGFRVAEVPEPTTLAMLPVAAMLAMRRRRR